MSRLQEYIRDKRSARARIFFMVIFKLSINVFVEYKIVIDDPNSLSNNGRFSHSGKKERLVVDVGG